MESGVTLANWGHRHNFTEPPSLYRPCGLKLGRFPKLKIIHWLRASRCRRWRCWREVAFLMLLLSFLFLKWKVRNWPTFCRPWRLEPEPPLSLSLSGRDSIFMWRSAIETNSPCVVTSQPTLVFAHHWGCDWSIGVIYTMLFRSLNL